MKLLLVLALSGIIIADYIAIEVAFQKIDSMAARVQRLDASREDQAAAIHSLNSAMQNQVTIDEKLYEHLERLERTSVRTSPTNSLNL